MTERDKFTQRVLDLKQHPELDTPRNRARVAEAAKAARRGAWITANATLDLVR